MTLTNMGFVQLVSFLILIYSFIFTVNITVVVTCVILSLLSTGFKTIFNHFGIDDILIKIKR